MAERPFSRKAIGETRRPLALVWVGGRRWGRNGRFPVKRLARQNGRWLWYRLGDEVGEERPFSSPQNIHLDRWPNGRDNPPTRKSNTFPKQNLARFGRVHVGVGRCWRPGLSLAKRPLPTLNHLLTNYPKLPRLVQNGDPRSGEASRLPTVVGPPTHFAVSQSSIPLAIEFSTPTNWTIWTGRFLRQTKPSFLYNRMA
jgi:hypothetical protein